MKSRSHRIPSSSVDRKDDWVEESWTVDCVCGVNFDDGEEMVDCDECGVWVHTRCARYVKTDKSFICNKCKNNNSRRGNHHRLRHNSNDSSEETEVAQLLVELPTKTLGRMDNNTPPHPLPEPPSSFKPSALTAPGRPSKLDVPIEEKVHVLGVPGVGSDPTLFSGVSSIFGPQLWKSTGYIPKKFNFRYREFPFWDGESEEMPEKENSVKKSEKQMDISANNGAKPLFSLATVDASKQEVPPAKAMPAMDFVGKESDAALKENSKFRGNNSDGLTSRNEASKDKNLLKPPLLHFEKRKKEDTGSIKDGNGKKRARLLEKDRDSNKKILLQTPDRGSMAVEVDPQCGNGGNLSQLSLDADVIVHAIDAQKFDIKENRKDQFPLKLEESSKPILAAPSYSGSNTSEAVSANEEVIVVTPHVSKGKSLTTGGTGSELVPEDSISVGPRIGDETSAPIHAKVKTELANCSSNANVKPSSLYDPHLSSSGTSLPSQERVASCLSGNATIADVNITGFTPHEGKRDAARKSNEVDLHKSRVEGHDPAGLNVFQESEDISSGFGSSAALGCNKVNVTTASPRAAAGDGTVVRSAGSTFLASGIPMSKSSARATSQNDYGDSKLKRIRKNNHEGASTELVEDVSRHERSRRSMKEHCKGAPSLPVQISSSQLKKLSHAATASKRASSDIKGSMLDSSSHPASEQANVQKTEFPMNIPKMSSALLESASVVGKAVTERPSNFQKVASALSERASNIEKAVKITQKVEKLNQVVSQSSSSKVNLASTHASASSNSPSTLSDEELALLLHQELNSSPRVPRVPRMRHAGSLPQLASSTTTSMLMKSTSSTGGKDHGLTFRRKTKGTGEMDDESKKMEKAVYSSTDHRQQDSAFVPDPINKSEADSGLGSGSYGTKKVNAPSRTAVSGSFSSLAEGNESSFSGTRLSSRVPPDDERVPVISHTHRTLPGLLAEIMSEGKRMTYEELCNSVLPHWPYLRKHNGERYAYSSHSQAVLDCLRNRNEWARLVDRGPKTSGGRKRRRADAVVDESEDNDDGGDLTKDGGSRRGKTGDSRQEELLKGKRNARKRRHLALQGRGIKDVRRLHSKKPDVSDEEEDGDLFSDYSTEETMSSEEDGIRGGWETAGGNNVSANSDGQEST